jgi:hypothetical protein
LVRYFTCRDSTAAGEAAISERFKRFTDDLPAICAATEREAGKLTFSEFADAASTWLKVEHNRLAARSS